MENKSLERKVLLGFLSGILILGVIGYLSYANISQLLLDAKWVDHTHTNLELADELLVKLLDAETGRRGYALTRDKQYLQPYFAATTDVDSLLLEIKSSVADNPVQLSKLQNLEPLIAKRMQLLKSSVDMLLSESSDSARQAGITLDGHVLMNQIRPLLIEFKNEEIVLLQNRRNKSEESSAKTIFSIVIGSGLAVIFLGLSFVVINRDIQRRNKAERELLDSQRELKTVVSFNEKILTYSLDMICSLDIEGVFLSVSPACERILGYKAGELVGRHYKEFVHPDDVEQSLKATRRIRNGEPMTEIENRYIRKDGTLVYLTWSSSWSEAEQFSIAVAHDITERKAVEEKVRVLNEQLSRRNIELSSVNKELESFSYSVSHDLRAPLRGIDGFSEILSSKYAGSLDATGMDYIKRIREATQRMGRLIDDLLNLSRLTRQDMVRTQFSISGMAKSIAASLSNGTTGRHIDWRIEEGLTADGDERLVYAVLENLLGNAWKYTGKHPRATIEFGAKTDGRNIIYYVRDDGAGFDMAYKDKLFGAFQRLHRISEFEGNGIGLATVQRIIHRHGGKVWAEGEVEKGASFYFTLS